MIQNQLSQQEARRLFDYRDGTLFWRHVGSGRRPDLRAVTVSGNRAEINIGGSRFQAQYVVWNWHHGITDRRLVFRDGDRANIQIDNLSEAEEFISALSPRDVSICPCCSQRTPAPSPFSVSFACGLTPIETKILAAVWAAAGHPVQTDKIFDRMYEDDANGGPSPQRMYATLKESLHDMRKKLAGSGVGIETVGYRQGFRLVLGKAA